MSLKDTILARGGEMGLLMRATDWASTALGPPEAWPQSLRTALGILLDSRFPTYIAWGPDFLQFYNDAYRPILGSTKHPAALGRRTAETFAESWDEYIGPLFRRVMDDGEPTYIEDWHLPLDRNGYLEECYFTFCYSAIREESGRVGGVLVTVVETTGRVLGARRLGLLRELASQGAEATGVAAVCGEVERGVTANSHDMPFALLYVADAFKVLHLSAVAGVAANERIAPAEIDADTTSPWPAYEVFLSTESRTLSSLPPLVLTGERPWPEAPAAAMVLPITGGQEGSIGVLIAGVSPRRALDAEYRTFLELVARQIGSAISNARAHEQERQRAESLAELDRAKTAFFSNISHEFRTPLTLLLAPLADALTDQATPLHAAQQERLAIAQRNGQRLLKLVNALLDFSRIEAGRMTGTFRRVDLAALTADIASSFRAAVERAGLTLAVKCTPLDEPAFVDPEMWETIVLNLLSNAFKFTFEGEIAVRQWQAGRALILEIRDTGVGIPPNELPRVFDRFHRVEGTRSRSFEGSGIGLSLVRELVRLHGGNITVDSVVERGTTICVSIPLGHAHLESERVVQDAASTRVASVARAYADEAAQWAEGSIVGEDPAERVAGARSRPVDARPSASPRKAGRVLVVDDNADMRGYLTRLLEPLFDVDVAQDGAEAIRVMGLRRPDVVVSDVMMPVMGGFDLVRTIRANDAWATTAIILLSARAGEEATVEGLRAGADEYLVKPFSARELVARVQSRMEITHTRAEGERRLSEIIRLAPAFIGVMRGPDHVFEMSNPPYDDLVGHRPLIGRTVREAFPEVEGQGIFELLDRVYATGEPISGSETRLVLRDEAGALRDRYVTFVYQALRNPNGIITGILAHGIDVTPQVEARKQLEKLYAVVAEANRAKSEFLSRMSHELRTPLNAILGFTELLAIGVRGPINAEQTSDLLRVERASKYLLGLINDILNFTKVEAGRVDFRFVQFPVSEVIVEVESLLAPLLAERGLVFEAQTSSAHRVNADPDRVRQILLNLLTNATKFTGRGGRISLETQAEAASVRTLVRDTGCGIAPDQIDRIFEPFVQLQTLDVTSLPQGTGLGLAISRELARAMGGDLTADSDVGEGSTFTLTLPTTRTGDAVA